MGLPSGMRATRRHAGCAVGMRECVRAYGAVRAYESVLGGEGEGEGVGEGVGVGV